MNSFEILNTLDKKLELEGFNSQLDLRRLNDDNKLIPMIDSVLDKDLLKKDITNYLYLLFYNHKYHYEKKMKIEQVTKGLRWNAYYMLALYSGNLNSYRNLPLILRQLINKLDINEYKSFSDKELVSKIYQTYDIKDGYDERHGHNMCEIIYKPISNKYDKYPIDYNYSNTNKNDKDEFSIWAEHDAYKKEVNSLKQYDNVIWVARDYGDGYGFDVLSRDLTTDKEKLIEVKSGKGDGFCLTENEYKVMHNCSFKNADYYIYKYTLQLDNSVTFNIFKYNPELDMLIDQDNNYYTFYEHKDTNEFNNIVYSYSILKKDLNKEKIKISI